MIEKFQGKTITDAILVEDALKFTFDDGTKATLWDDGQCCCEHRYVTCDDDPKSLIGGTLLAVEVRDANISDDYEDDVHEAQFVEVQTSIGLITLTTHNEHNGYYGGFHLRME